MMQLIKIKNIKDVKKINAIVSKYGFDDWVHGKSGIANAKSILGMYVLKLNELLTLVVPDDEYKYIRLHGTSIPPSPHMFQNI
ncbi:MAG: HPr family phosphocarrier protein [Paenibacillaceae bacterium]